MGVRCSYTNTVVEMETGIGDMTALLEIWDMNNAIILMFFFRTLLN